MSYITHFIKLSYSNASGRAEPNAERNTLEQRECEQTALAGKCMLAHPEYSRRYTGETHRPTVVRSKPMCGVYVACSLSNTK